MFLLHLPKVLYNAGHSSIRKGIFLTFLPPKAVSFQTEKFSALLQKEMGQLWFLLEIPASPGP